MSRQRCGIRGENAANWRFSCRRSALFGFLFFLRVFLGSWGKFVSLFFSLFLLSYFDLRFPLSLAFNGQHEFDSFPSRSESRPKKRNCNQNASKRVSCQRGRASASASASVSDLDSDSDWDSASASASTSRLRFQLQLGSCCDLDLNLAIGESTNVELNGEARRPRALELNCKEPRQKNKNKNKKNTIAGSLLSSPSPDAAPDLACVLYWPFIVKLNAYRCQSAPKLDTVTKRQSGEPGQARPAPWLELWVQGDYKGLHIMML